jgi:hypothetical protein
VTVPHARNLGARHARTELVAFTADDCLVAADWLDRLREGFADPRVGFVTGRVRASSPMRTSRRSCAPARPHGAPVGLVDAAAALAGAVRGSVLAVRVPLGDAAFARPARAALGLDAEARTPAEVSALG